MNMENNDNQGDNISSEKVLSQTCDDIISVIQQRAGNSVIDGKYFEEEVKRMCADITARAISQAQSSNIIDVGDLGDAEVEDPEVDDPVIKAEPDENNAEDEAGTDRTIDGPILNEDDDDDDEQEMKLEMVCESSPGALFVDLKGNPGTNLENAVMKLELRGTDGQLHTKVTYACPKCAINFGRRSHLIRHLRMNRCFKKKQMRQVVAPKKRSFTCLTCDKIFYERYLFQEHRIFHVNQPAICTICDKQFTTIAGLRFHRQSIHADPGTFLCDVCGDEFPRRVDLNRHTRANHVVRETPCSVCDRMFINTKYRDKHMQVHTSLKEFICTEENCGQIFRSKAEWKAHSLRHIDERPFKCQLCDKAYKLKKHLNCHMKKHSDTAPHICPVCSEGFWNKEKLQIHSAEHSGVHPFQCAECSKTFSSRKGLKKHESMHTGEMAHTCTRCYKSFRLPQSLSLHMRVHNGEKRYQCAQCVKAFVDSSSFKRHQLQHNGLRPYVCDICGKDFTQSNCIKGHYKVHHPGVEMPPPRSILSASYDKVSHPRTTVSKEWKCFIDPNHPEYDLTMVDQHPITSAENQQVDDPNTFEATETDNSAIQLLTEIVDNSALDLLTEVITVDPSTGEFADVVSGHRGDHLYNLKSSDGIHYEIVHYELMDNVADDLQTNDHVTAATNDALTIVS